MATRPLTYDGPLEVRKPINFTKRQVAEIQEICGPTVDFGTFVREAVLSVVHNRDTAQKENAIGIEKAVLTALRKYEKEKTGGIEIKLSSDLEDKLEQVSTSIGFSEPSQLIEELLRVMLREPTQIREFVLGKALLDIEHAFGMTPDLEAEKPKKLRKAG